MWYLRLRIHFDVAASADGIGTAGSFYDFGGPSSRRSFHGPGGFERKSVPSFSALKVLISAGWYLVTQLRWLGRGLFFSQENASLSTNFSMLTARCKVHV